MFAVHDKNRSAVFMNIIHNYLKISLKSFTDNTNTNTARKKSPDKRRVEEKQNNLLLD